MFRRYVGLSFLLTGFFFHRAIACAWGYLLSLPRRQTRDYDDDIGSQCELAMIGKKGRGLHFFSLFFFSLPQNASSGRVLMCTVGWQSLF